MGSLDAIHRCTLGGSAFQLEDFTHDEEPIVRSGGRRGTMVTVSGIGYVEGESASSLATAVTNAVKACRFSGINFEIFGAGGVSMLRLTAAMCVDGGPHVRCRVDPGLQDSGGVRRFRFEVMGETSPEPGEGEDGPTATRSVDVGPDDLRVITWSGELATTDAGSAAAAFVSLSKTFRENFPPPRWVLLRTFHESDASGKGSFELAVREMADDLPVAGESAAVDGRASHRVDRDEQMRLVKTYEYDLIVVGDPQDVLDLVRPQGVTILREVVEVGHLRQRTVRALFVTLEGGNGNALMDWQASIQWQPPTDVYTVKIYPGSPPQLVNMGTSPGRMVFSGYAIGAGQFIEPPAAPGKPSAYHVEQPVVTYTHVNAVEKRTEWMYTMVMFSQGPPLYMLERPALSPPKQLPGGA